MENILLVALEEGLGSCCIGAINREKLREVLKIPRGYEISLVVALGYGKEKSRVEEFSESVKYWQDPQGVLRVPKRSLKEILHRDEF